MIQKLEDQIATLQHQIQPWMMMSIAESEERMERMMAHYMEVKIIEAKQRLYDFKLYVLAQPAPLWTCRPFRQL